MKRVLYGLWPTWPGLAVPGIWGGYVASLAIRGLFTSPRALLVALWPMVPLYLGACLLAAWERRDPRPRLRTLVLVAVALAGVDLAVKVWIDVKPLAAWQPLTVLPGLLAVDPVHNVYGTMLAIPGVVPYITLLAVVLVPISILGYRRYIRDEQPVAWGHAAFVGFLAGSLAKAGDLLWRGLIIDYLHIPHLPVADLADIYLLWVGGGCILAASFCYPESWPDLRGAAQRVLARIRGE